MNNTDGARYDAAMRTAQAELVRRADLTRQADLVRAADLVLPQPQPVDIGAENIARASELSSQALREAFAESAKRAIDMALANLKRAEEDCKAAEKFAKAVNDYAERMCADLEAGFSRAQTMTENMALTLSMIAAKPE